MALRYAPSFDRCLCIIDRRRPACDTARKRKSSSTSTKCTKGDSSIKERTRVEKKRRRTEKVPVERRSSGVGRAHDRVRRLGDAGSVFGDPGGAPSRAGINETLRSLPHGR